MPNRGKRGAKPESRNPKSERSPKSECRNEFSTPSENVRVFIGTNPLIRISSFGFLSDFGDSHFGIRVRTGVKQRVLRAKLPGLLGLIENHPCHSRPFLLH
jgi:hypothetical protein